MHLQILNKPSCTSHVEDTESMYFHRRKTSTSRIERKRTHLKETWQGCHEWSSLLMASSSRPSISTSAIAAGRSLAFSRTRALDRVREQLNIHSPSDFCAELRLYAVPLTRVSAIAYTERAAMENLLPRLRCDGASIGVHGPGLDSGIFCKGTVSFLLLLWWLK